MYHINLKGGETVHDCGIGQHQVIQGNTNTGKDTKSDKKTMRWMWWIICDKMCWFFYATIRLGLLRLFAMIFFWQTQVMISTLQFGVKRIIAKDSCCVCSMIM